LKADSEEVLEDEMNLALYLGQILNWGKRNWVW
jgi:hypothetical protein